MAQTGIEMSWIIALFQDFSGGIPGAYEAEEFAEAIGDPDYPVVADIAGRLTSATPWDGQTLPGKCALSPTMEILECFVSVDNTRAFDAIQAHHQAADR